MAQKPPTPRQQIFTELEKRLQRAREVFQKEPGARTFEDLGAILFLARETASALRTYQIRRDLLLRIYALLVSDQIDLEPLDVNWDGQGLLPTTELPRHLGTIAVAVANRLPIDESTIENPFDGKKITCAALRSAFGEHCTSLGVPHAAQAFAAA
ncbi:MAG: hypothetical protein AAB413_01540 [Patescibacteria group bacterium]